MRSEEEIRARLEDRQQFLKDVKTLTPIYEYPRTEREVEILEWVLNDKGEKQLTTHILAITTPEILTKDSPPVICEEFECARCGFKSDMGFLSFHHRDGMDYMYEDSKDGWRHCPPDEKIFVYVCYDCDWELMNGYGWECGDEETDEDEEMF